MTEKELLRKQIIEEIKSIEYLLDTFEQSYADRMRMKSDLRELKQTLKGLDKNK